MDLLEPLAVWTFLVLFGSLGTYFLYERRQRQHAELESDSHLRPMGLLSQIWHILHLRNKSPIIHGFEQFDESVDFATFQEFWVGMARDYLTFRCMPFKPKHSKNWYWKELSLDSIDFKGYHVQKVVLSASDCACNQTTSLPKGSLDPKAPLQQAYDAVTEFVNNKLGMNLMWDTDRPQWSAYYITFQEEHLKHYVFGYTRLHHAMGDGVLLTKVLQYQHEKFSKECESKTPGSNDAAVTSADTSDVKKLKKKSTIVSRLTKILTYVSLIPWSLFDFHRYALFGEAPKNTPISLGYSRSQSKTSSHKRSEGEESQCNMAVSQPIPLHALKQLSKRLKGTINDVVVSLICHAVNKYMKRVLAQDTDGTDAAWTELKKQYGNEFYIRSVSMFNMRSLVAQDMEKLIDEFASGEFDNNFASIMMRLPIGDMQFEDRFVAVKDVFDRIKKGPMPMLSTLAIKMLYWIGGTDLVMWLMDRLCAECSFLLSNVAGPRKSVSLPGSGANEKSIGNLFNCVNPNIIAINFCVMSYVDKINFGVSSDSDTVKDPQLLVNCVREVFESLMQDYKM